MAPPEPPVIAASVADALAMLERVAEDARSQPDAHRAFVSAIWLHGFLSTLTDDGIATAEVHADRVAKARELLPLLSLVRAWQARTGGPHT